MIASLAGNVVALEAGSAIIDVAGVGYLVQITSNTAHQLQIGQSTLLNTSLIVREDGFTLFGFTSITEQKVFDLLRSVSGVGPKSALAILGTLTVEQIIDAVGLDNDAAFRSVSGIGPKTAKLIIVTLAGKLVPNQKKVSRKDSAAIGLVVTALTGLGWTERIALEAANQAVRELGESASSNNLLKAALSQLGSSKTVSASDE